jgi:hypothetical protein
MTMLNRLLHTTGPETNGMDGTDAPGQNELELLMEGESRLVALQLAV